MTRSPADSTRAPQSTPEPSLRRISRIVLIVATLVALSIAFYLSYMKLTGQISNLAGCGGEEGCASLLGSRWSNWMKVPVSLWSLGVYVPLLLLGCLGLTSPGRRQLAIIATSILVSVACWFLVVQMFFEGKFCPYCCAMHACSVLAFVCVAIISMPHPPRENLRHLALAIPLAAASVATLAAGQMWGPQVATYEITQDDTFGEDLEGVDFGFDSTDDASLIDGESPTNGEATRTGPVDTGPVDVEVDQAIPGAVDLSMNQRMRDRLPGAVVDRLNGSRIGWPHHELARNHRTAVDYLQARLSHPPQTRLRFQLADKHAPVSQLVQAKASNETFDLPDFDERSQSEADPVSKRQAKPALSPATTELSQTNSGTSVPAEKTKRRVASYFGGIIKYSVDEVPLIGSPAATHILVKYFDYTCPSCKKMHDDLEETLRLYPDKLAVIVIPCPLEHSCNPHSVTKFVGNKDPHAGACELSEVALAVWRADRARFRKFHDELFDRQGLITPKAAHIIAESLVGKDELAKASTEDWIRQVTRSSIAIYGKMKDRNPRMPKLLLGERKVMHGVTANSDTFQRVIREVLDAPSTTAP